MKPPFTIAIDTAEQQPFTFAGLIGDAKDDHEPLSVETVRMSLGRHPDSCGDYSVAEFGVGRIGVERKSREDAQSTILGWRRPDEEFGHRDRFERELHNLSQLEAALVVVECPLDELVETAPETPGKTAKENGKILFRSVLAYMQDYHVPWLFCGSRRLAEVATYRFLERWADEDRRRRRRLRREAQKTLEGM